MKEAGTGSGTELMGWWQNVLQWRDDRVALAHLAQREAEIIERYRPLLSTAKAKSRDDYEKTYHDQYFELEMCWAEIGEVTRRQMVSKALRFGVVVPERPRGNEDNDCWIWNSQFGTHFLTPTGLQHLRREIAFEQELRQKPWLSWGAFLIAALSLIVSVAVAIWK